MSFLDRTGRQGARHNPRVPEVDVVNRSAPLRNRALCAGVDRLVAAVVGIKAQPPQPHHWWPVGRRGQLCLRCSRYEK